MVISEILFLPVARPATAVQPAWRRLQFVGREKSPASFADQGSHPPPQGHQRSEPCEKRIAVVFKVQFEPLARKYGGTAVSPAMLPRKRKRGALEQEDATDPPIDVSGNPETSAVAADEKRRNRLIDDARIERPKLRDNGRGLICREDSGPIAAVPDHYGRWSPAEQGLQPFPGLLLRLHGIYSDRGHGDLLANPCGMMCR
jgi:hypothetical protein